MQPEEAPEIEHSFAGILMWGASRNTAARRGHNNIQPSAAPRWKITTRRLVRAPG